MWYFAIAAQHTNRILESNTSEVGLIFAVRHSQTGRCHHKHNSRAAVPFVSLSINSIFHYAPVTLILHAYILSEPYNYQNSSILYRSDFRLNKKRTFHFFQKKFCLKNFFFVVAFILNAVLSFFLVTSIHPSIHPKVGTVRNGRAATINGLWHTFIANANFKILYKTSETNRGTEKNEIRSSFLRTNMKQDKSNFQRYKHYICHKLNFCFRFLYMWSEYTIKCPG